MTPRTSQPAPSGTHPGRLLRLGARYATWMMPSFVLVGVLSVVVWVWFAFDSVGGFGRATQGERLFIFGFAGIALLTIFSTAVLSFVVENAVNELRSDVEGMKLPASVMADIAALVHTRAAIREHELAEIEQAVAPAAGSPAP